MNSITKYLLLLVAVCTFLLISCKDDNADMLVDQNEEQEEIDDEGEEETDDPFVELNLPDEYFNYANQDIPDYITKDNTPSDNPITDEGATLGRVLFYDKKLSSNNEIACSNCHQQEYAFSDIAELSQGIGGITQRHSMRSVNIRFGDDDKFRWDRTAETLEDQMIIPIKKHGEMGYSGEDGNPTFDDLITELGETTYYPVLFEDAFGDETITEDRMARALSQFVRSIQSFDTKYDEGRAQVDNDLEDFPNFTADENAGKRLFIEDFEFETDQIEVDGEIFSASKRISGGFNCATCHRPPEFDIDPESLNNGFIRGNPELGIPVDYEVTRTPTMREVMDYNNRLNGGMMHAGQALNMFGLRAHYDFRQIEERNNKLDARYTPGDLPQWLDMTDEEEDQLIRFMRTLSGTNVYTDEKYSNPFKEE